MAKHGLIIRNIDGCSMDDLRVALQGLAPEPNAPAEFNQLLQLIESNTPQVNQALTLFKTECVRDYLYERIKAKTGHHVIYHLNGVDHDGRLYPHHVDYITDKLRAIPANTNFDLVYIGGGHGHPISGLSNLTVRQLTTIQATLNGARIKSSALILGSCFSTAYLKYFQPLLKDDALTLSNSLECGGSNLFKQTMEWINGQREEFFSKQDLMDSVKIGPEAQAALLGNTDRNLLSNRYKQLAQKIMGNDFPLEEIEEFALDNLERDLNSLIIQLQCEEKPVQNNKIEEILQGYPLINAWRATQGGFNVDNLLPNPTTLVVGDSKTLSLHDFENPHNIPSYIDEGYRKHYQYVLAQIVDLGLNIHEEFNALDAKRLFNQALKKASLKVVVEPLRPVVRAPEPVIIPIEPVVKPLVPELAQDKAKKQPFNQAFTEIDTLLNQFEVAIQSIGKHYPEAKHLATNILCTLREYKKKAAETNTKDSMRSFARETRVLIDSALPALHKDLSWGDYLANLTKQIVNAITMAVAYLATFGHSNHCGFFALKYSDAEKVTDNLTSELVNICLSVQ